MTAYRPLGRLIGSLSIYFVFLAGFGVLEYFQWIRIEISCKGDLLRPPDLKSELKIFNFRRFSESVLRGCTWNLHSLKFQTSKLNFLCLSGSQPLLPRYYWYNYLQIPRVWQDMVAWRPQREPKPWQSKIEVFNPWWVHISGGAPIFSYFS